MRGVDEVHEVAKGLHACLGGEGELAVSVLVGRTVGPEVGQVDRLQVESSVVSELHDVRGVEVGVSRSLARSVQGELGGDLAQRIRGRRGVPGQRGQVVNAHASRVQQRLVVVDSDVRVGQSRHAPGGSLRGVLGDGGLRPSRTLRAGDGLVDVDQIAGSGVVNEVRGVGPEHVRGRA